jgi:DNA-3-methyladenine glycosylase
MLLGCTLVRMLPDGTRLAGTIVETEAYVGIRDRACHSFGGRRTPRNEVMYASAGSLYVYFTYGMHFCCNVVCGEVNEPIAVLLRALEPIEGLESMRTNRPGAKRDRDLCAGPARLCQALQIAREQNGIDLVTSPNLWIERSPSSQHPAFAIIAGPRIGIGSGNVWTHRLLRFGVRGHPCLSVPFPRSARKMRQVLSGQSSTPRKAEGRTKHQSE